MEARFDPMLWRYEEWMQLLSPVRYSDRVPNRILVVGPSEAREAFWAEPFERVLGPVRLINDSLSLSTFEDVVTQLDYVERVYGPQALGDVLVVAVSPRLLQNYAPGERPLPILLNRYSPYFSLDERVEPQALVPKSPVASLLGRIRTAGHSAVRYQRAVRALLLVMRSRFRNEDLAAAFRSHGLVGSKFFADPPRNRSEYYEWVRTGEGILPSMQYFFKLRDMNLLDRRADVLRDFSRLRDIAARCRARVLVVNLPEGGWARGSFYNEGIHEAYDAVLREAVGDLPLLDLREFVADDGFVDWMHPNWASSLRISERVAQEIGRMTRHD